MTNQVYINLPVRDLQKSIRFYTEIGFVLNPKFTNDKGACIVIGANICAMLLTREFFGTFTKKEVSDAVKSTEVLIAIDTDSRAAVNEIIGKAVNAGGTTYMEPQDHGWYYSQSFADLDGHQWEVFYMDENMPGNPA